MLSSRLALAAVPQFPRSTKVLTSDNKHHASFQRPHLKTPWFLQPICPYSAPLAIHGSHPSSCAHTHVLISESPMSREERLLWVLSEMKGTRCSCPSRMLDLLGTQGSKPSWCQGSGRGCYDARRANVHDTSCVSRTLKPISHGEMQVCDFPVSPKSKHNHWRFYRLFCFRPSPIRLVCTGTALRSDAAVCASVPAGAS